MSVGDVGVDAELTDLEENEVMNLQSEPESKHQENAETETRTKKKRKQKEHKSKSKAKSTKVLCTEALKHIEERARARWAFESGPGSGSEHESVDARAESDGSAGLQVGVWLPSGSAS